MGPLIDHDDLMERKEFQGLTQYLFGKDLVAQDATTMFAERIKVYDEIVKYFPKEMKQPEVDLMDLIPIDF